MKLRSLSIFAVAATVALAACGGGDEPAEGDDTTGVVTDTSTVAPAPPMTPDTSMMAPPPADTGAMGTDTMGGDTTKM